MPGILLTWVTSQVERIQINTLAGNKKTSVRTCNYISSVSCSFLAVLPKIGGAPAGRNCLPRRADVVKLHYRAQCLIIQEKQCTIHVTAGFYWP